MRINYYSNLQQFYDEYSDIPIANIRKFIGIEFIYKNKYYRMCNEPKGSGVPCDSNGTELSFAVYEVDWHGNICGHNFTYTPLGFYHDLDEVLDNCIIQGRKFKDIIMDDNTEIISQD